MPRSSAAIPALGMSDAWLKLSIIFFIKEMSNIYADEDGQECDEDREEFHT